MNKNPINRLFSRMAVNSGRRTDTPAKGVRVKSPSRVRIPLSRQIFDVSFQVFEFHHSVETDHNPLGAGHDKRRQESTEQITRRSRGTTGPRCADGRVYVDWTGAQPICDAYHREN